MLRLYSGPQQSTPLGISAISTYRPDWILPNKWFQSNISRKFVKHTGILARPISDEDEVSLAVRSVQRMVQETGCDLRDCAAVIFISPSFIPMAIARQFMDRQRATQEQLSRAANRFVKEIQIHPRRVLGINSFCSGYAKAMALVQNKLVPTIDLQTDEFILVVTSSRISRITDFSCKQSGTLFGDLATATLVSRCDSHRYPVHFELVDAQFEKQPTNRPFFNFELREQVLAPTVDGGRTYDPQRVVFSLDGMGIADVAPRAMASAAEKIAEANGLRPQDVRFIVPHQAGAGIVRLAGMKLEAAGFSGQLVNGMTRDVGNVSSCSVPYALKNWWNRLDGTILCPVAAVGAPGKCEVSQGCIALQTTPRHNVAAA